MTDEISFEIKSQALLLRISHFYGAKEVLDYLNKIKGDYPGLNLARAVAENVVSGLRADLSSETLIATARHGVPVGDMKNISTEMRNGKWFVVCEPYDLADPRNDDDVSE